MSRNRTDVPITLTPRSLTCQGSTLRSIIPLLLVVSSRARTWVSAISLAVALGILPGKVDHNGICGELNEFVGFSGPLRMSFAGNAFRNMLWFWRFWTYCEIPNEVIR